MSNPSKRLWTPGPWTTYRMTIDGEDPSPEQLGEYVKNTVLKSAEKSGTLSFLYVSCTKDDGDADVCHVGNGPTSPANARLIAAAPELFEALASIASEPHAPNCAVRHLPPNIAVCLCHVGMAHEALASALGEGASDE